MHLTRLELAHPKALPPQGSVYTNFTTGACVYYNIFFRYGEKNLEIMPILWAARFLEFFIQNRDLKTLYVLWSAVFKSFLHRPINNIIKAVFTRD